MITHIVQWRVRDEVEGKSKGEILPELRKRLEGLNGRIPEIITLSVGLNERPGEHASDVVLLSTFADWESFKRYVEHPDHQEVVKYVGRVVKERRVVDFES